ncbi:hypothetical protein FE633_09850 [Streptomyces montanus]|uniref:Uncharacterized protein n=1 Tax=Streptomyces montanus TaxID=2580423 RepID=A0A5R9FY59_9ACTN|nr:hypothetical protein [Streptomyces montanus]TLS46238.1 hypothetical protein FE633_09850 [Streptomyces montanus]
MSRRGRRASLPPGDHSRPEPLDPGGLVVRHVDRNGRVRAYDFARLLVAEPMQRSLAVLFAARCTPNRWGSHRSSRLMFQLLEKFTALLSGLERPPRDVEELTTAQVKQWRLSQAGTAGGHNAITRVGSLLRQDARLASGPVADELAVRTQRPKSKTQSYSEDEFDRIKRAARRTFRAALLRINDNAAHLERWRAGAFAPGSHVFILGEALDSLARTGDIPRRVSAKGARNPVWRFHRVLGNTSPAATWQRLFLSRLEAAALGVLLMAEFGWNLSVIHQAKVPKASPDPGEDGQPTYRIPVVKYRRGGGRYFESRNVTDDGAGSPGRLITEALQATRFARAVVEDLAPGTDLLIVWRWAQGGHAITTSDHHPPVGLFRFGVIDSAGSAWARAEGLNGSPFRRGRRTVNALVRREPGQNSQATHDRDYVLVDQRVQQEAADIIAAGAEDAAARARQAVLVAEVRAEPDTDDRETATADCHDYEHSPFTRPGKGCRASFLLCLGCPNARIHPGHHARLAHLHRALNHLRSAQPPTVWEADWGEAHARLEDLKRRLGEPVWAQALACVTDADRDLIDCLLTGVLDA